MSSTHEHLEHAEHASHHAHNPFDKRVAMTMAIVAATLAMVSMLAHRAHNKVLSLKTEHSTLAVQESNAWSQYQAKRMRQEMSITTKMILEALPEAKTATQTKSPISKLDKRVSDYKTELAEITLKAKGYAQKAKETDEEAEHTHHQADRIDLAHLGTELGLILCSIAVLTKRRSFWYSGILVTVLGLAILGSAYLMDTGHHKTEHPPTSTEEAPVKEKSAAKDHH